MVMASMGCEKSEHVDAEKINGHNLSVINCLTCLNKDVLNWTVMIDKFEKVHKPPAMFIF